MGKKSLWYDGRDITDYQDFLPLVFNSQYECIILEQNAIDNIKIPGRIKLIVKLDTEEQLKTIDRKSYVLSDNDKLLHHAYDEGFSTAYYVKISNKDDLDAAWKIGQEFDFVIVELTSPTNIPLELLIAKLHESSTQVIKVVNSAQEAEIAFGVMELGSDGVLLRSQNFNEIIGLNQYITRNTLSKIEFVKGKVIDVQHAGMGHRACIDTTSLLENNEGMIVGSTSQGGLLVSSETHFLPYMNLRPFRVNAGAVHSYVWVPDYKTEYITELKAGSKILVINTQGIAREVTVGRVKTELRPLLKIEVQAGDITVNTFVQDDWHIRIFGAEGQPLNASEIKVGDELLTFMCEAGRHVGIKINESIIEK